MAKCVKRKMFRFGLIHLPKQDLTSSDFCVKPDLHCPMLQMVLSVDHTHCRQFDGHSVNKMVGFMISQQSCFNNIINNVQH